MANELPPMQDEPNQAEIDAETARRLREAAKENNKKIRIVNYAGPTVTGGPAPRLRLDGGSAESTKGNES